MTTFTTPHRFRNKKFSFHVDEKYSGCLNAMIDFDVIFSGDSPTEDVADIDYNEMTINLLAVNEVSIDLCFGKEEIVLKPKTKTIEKLKETIESELNLMDWEEIQKEFNN